MFLFVGWTAFLVVAMANLIRPDTPGEYCSLFEPKFDLAPKTHDPEKVAMWAKVFGFALLFWLIQIHQYVQSL